MTDTPLQEWIDNHEIGSEMLWKTAARHQLQFVRDDVHALIWHGIPYEERKVNPVRVVSEHHSKSILLPVYEIVTPSWAREVPGYEVGPGFKARIRMRANFYNWVISVESTLGVHDRFRDLFDRENVVKSIYAEGFEDDWVFPPYAENRKNFTVSLGGEYSVWTFLWLLRAQ